MTLCRFLFLFAFLSAQAVSAAEPNTAAETMIHEYNARLEEVMQKLEKAVDAGADALIAAQTDDKKAGDIALIMGIFHHIGHFHGVDIPKAGKFMELAHEKGVVEAGVALGELNLGFAVPGAKSEDRDLDKALAYLNAAAAADSVDALRVLGLLYAEGADGLPADPEKAEEYFLAAARHGDPESLIRLTPLFEQAAAWECEHPGETAQFPSSPDKIIVPELAAAAAERNRELGRMADMIATESEKWAAAVLGEEEGL